ncbi:CapA family protein [Labilithrix luteola]|nr:CapA family protein [Labilithrix luteola]
MARCELFLCGDVMTGRGIDQILPTPSKPQLYEPWLRDAREYVELAERASGRIARPVDFAYIWGDALAELGRVRPDARIVNLETAVTTSEDAWPDKDINYRMHPANVECLTALGIDVCVLANNHVLDWGYGGLVETLDCLCGAGMRTVGAGRTALEAEAPAIVATGSGGRVVVFAVGHVSSGIPSSWAAKHDVPGIAVLHDLGPNEADTIVERAALARQLGDVVVVSIHWGTNWGYEIPDEHVRFAHALVDGGIDVVHGHSSHHPRAIEVYRGKPIFYGCGDFMTDYEGIHGYEAFRPALSPMYFTTFEVTDRGSSFVALRIVPFRLRKMRLERATRAESEPLVRACQRFDTKIALLEDGSLVTPARARRP